MIEMSSEHLSYKAMFELLIVVGFNSDFSGAYMLVQFKVCAYIQFTLKFNTARKCE